MAISRGVRAALGVVIALVVLVIGGLLALPALVNVNQYHDRIQAELQKNLGRPVTLGNLELKTFPVRVRVEDVNIAEDPNFATGSPFAVAKQLDVSVALLPLLSKSIEVNSLDLIHPQVQLVRNRQGVWNYSTLGNTSAQPTEKKSSSGQQLSVSDFKLTDGTVTVIDSFQPPGSVGPATTKNTYDHIDLAVKNFAPNKNFDIDLTAHLPGQGNQSIALAGNVGPLNSANSANTPVDAKLTMNSVQIAALQQFLHSAALEDTFGVATGNVNLKNRNGNFAANGNLKLDDGKLHGVELGYPLSADFDVKGELNSQLFDISKMDLKLGPTPVSISGQINEKSVPALADLRVKASDASLTEIARLASAFGVAVAADTKVSGRLNADLSAKGALDAPAMNGTLQLTNVQLSGAQIKQPVNIPSLRLVLTPTQLRSDPFVVNSGDMHINTTFAMTNYASTGKTPATPQVQFTLNADKINAQELQAMFSAAPSNTQKQKAHRASLLVPEAYAAEPGQPSAISNITGGGTISVGQLVYQGFQLDNVHSNVQLDHGIIRMAPLTSEIFGGSQSGSITVDARPAQPVITTNLQVQKVDANKLLTAATSAKQQLYGLLNAGGNLGFTDVAKGNLASTLNGTVNLNLQNGKLAGVDLLKELGSIAKFGAGGNGFTNIAQLAGSFNIRNGLAHTDNLKASIDGGTLAGIGDINMATQQLNMKITAVLNSAMSKQVGGTGIGGYLNTALANQSGELVIPVIVTGSVQSPHFQPDVQQIANMKIKNLLPTTGNPAGALSGFLGGNANGGKGGALGGVLGALSGQQQQQQQGQQQQQQASPQDAINGLLGQFGKKKPK